MKISYISGAHRSGTTWLGNILAHANDCAVIHEPFNYSFGIDGVPCWYPNGATSQDRIALQTLFYAVTDGSARYKNYSPDDNLIKQIIRKKIGGRLEFEYRRLMRKKNENLILKDPFLSRMAPHLSEPGIIVVRHPAAYLAALKRMNWGVPNMTEMDTSHRHTPSKNILKNAQNVGRFWAHIYAPLIAKKDDQHNKYTFIKHEDLCLNAEKTITEILLFLDLEFTQNMRNYLNFSMNGSVIHPQGKQLHLAQRDSKNIPDKWKDELTDDEIEIVWEQAGNSAKYFYEI